MMSVMCNFEIDKRLRRKFKGICAYFEQSQMKPVLINEVNNIIDNDKEVIKIIRPDKEDIGSLTIVLDIYFKKKLKNYCKNRENKITMRNLIVTAMLNVIRKYEPDYDYSYLLK